MTTRLEPGECYSFWEHLSPGFRRPTRDLAASDLEPGDRARISAGLAAALPSGLQPIIKLTGWPRIGFLRAVYPESRFVHIVRDGRAVAASLLRVDFWRGWQGPEHWRWGPLSEEDADTWHRSGEAPAVLAGLQWKMLTAATDAARAALPSNQFLEVRYEDLCTGEGDDLDRVLRHGGLSCTAAVQEYLEAQPFVNANNKWPDQMDSDSRRHLESALAEPLARFGYS